MSRSCSPHACFHYFPAKLTRHPLTADLANSAGEPVPVETEAPLTRAVRAFAEGVRTGDRAQASLALGVSVVRILDRCQRTLAT